MIDRGSNDGVCSVIMVDSGCMMVIEQWLNDGISSWSMVDAGSTVIMAIQGTLSQDFKSRMSMVLLGPRSWAKTIICWDGCHDIATGAGNDKVTDQHISASEQRMKLTSFHP